MMTTTEQLDRHERELYGDGSNLGLTQKVNVLWRVHVWLLCLVSGFVGSALTIGIQKVIHP